MVDNENEVKNGGGDMIRTKTMVMARMGTRVRTMMVIMVVVVVAMVVTTTTVVVTTTDTVTWDNGDDGNGEA